MSETLILAFHQGTVYSFVKANERTFSTFGGPLINEVVGMPSGRKSLHQICELSGQHIREVGAGITFVYGMYYSGCTLRYRHTGKIELTELNETTPFAEDWPYPNFPPMLPFFSLNLAEKKPATYQEFAERFPNMPEMQPSDLVVAIPPPSTIGISLWGSGDLEDVTIVFECDLKTRSVYGYNVTN